MKRRAFFAGLLGLAAPRPTAATPAPRRPGRREYRITLVLDAAGVPRATRPRRFPLGRGPVYWNPYNRVVQDHRDGTVDRAATDRERAARGLPVPWTPAVGAAESRAGGETP